jgi:hypothetical protein
MPPTMHSMPTLARPTAGAFEALWRYQAQHSPEQRQQQSLRRRVLPFQGIRDDLGSGSIPTFNVSKKRLRAKPLLLVESNSRPAPQPPPVRGVGLFASPQPVPGRRGELEQQDGPASETSQEEGQ